jgi:hypothetical protein
MEVANPACAPRANAQVRYRALPHALEVGENHQAVLAAAAQHAAGLGQGGVEGAGLPVHVEHVDVGLLVKNAAAQGVVALVEIESNS